MIESISIRGFQRHQKLDLEFGPVNCIQGKTDVDLGQLVDFAGKTDIGIVFTFIPVCFIIEGALPGNLSA
jgi:hypothetical protein